MRTWKGVVEFEKDFFRNGDYLAFDGDLNRPVEVVNWLTGTDALEVVGIVEKVNPHATGTIGSAIYIGKKIVNVNEDFFA